MLAEWLNGIFVAESLESGLEQRAGLASGEMLVTREGNIITPHSLTYYAPDSHLHGVLARQREIGQITTEKDGLRGALSAERSSLQHAEERCSELESSVSDLRRNIGQLQQQHHDAEMQALKLAQLAERTDQRYRQIESELDEIAYQARGEVSRKLDAEKKLAEYRAQQFASSDV